MDTPDAPMATPDPPREETEVERMIREALEFERAKYDAQVSQLNKELAKRKEVTQGQKRDIRELQCAAVLSTRSSLSPPAI